MRKQAGSATVGALYFPRPEASPKSFTGFFITSTYFNLRHLCIVLSTPYLAFSSTNFPSELYVIDEATSHSTDQSTTFGVGSLDGDVRNHLCHLTFKAIAPNQRPSTVLACTSYYPPFQNTPKPGHFRLHTHRAVARCYDNYDNAYTCNNSTWSNWGRWVSLVVIIVVVILIFFLFS